MAEVFWCISETLFLRNIFCRKIWFWVPCKIKTFLFCKNLDNNDKNIVLKNPQYWPKDRQENPRWRLVMGFTTATKCIKLKVSTQNFFFELIVSIGHKVCPWKKYFEGDDLWVPPFPLNPHLLWYRGLPLGSMLFCSFFPTRFMQLIGVVTSDPSVLARMGELYDNEGDKSQAFQYYYDVSYLFFKYSFRDGKNCLMLIGLHAE